MGGKNDGGDADRVAKGMGASARAGEAAAREAAARPGGKVMSFEEFGRQQALDEPEFASEYAKDYWDLVFEQLGKRTLFKAGVVVLTLLYGMAIFAPLIANDKPYLIESVDVKAHSSALRISPMASQAAKTARESDEAFLKSVDKSNLNAPKTRVEKVKGEYDAALLRVATLRRGLSLEDAAPLDGYVAAFDQGMASLGAGDNEAAVASFDEAKAIAKAVRKDLKPLNVSKPDKGGMALVPTVEYPLLKSIAWWEVFLMALWVLTALWPVWNWILNRLILFGNKDRIRAARKPKLLAVIAVAAACSFAYHSHFGSVAQFDSSNFKQGLTDGNIVPLQAGHTTADLAAAAQAEGVPPSEASLAGRVVWAPIRYGFAELHEDEKFRAPTWTDKGEVDPATGRPVYLLESDKDVQEGFVQESRPVEIRVAEPELNSPWRHALGTDESGRDMLSRMIWGARISLSVGILSAILLTFIGVVIGSIAGFFGGVVDDLIMRGIEILQSIPAFFLILVALAFTDPDTVPPMFAIVVVIALVRWTGVARLVRGEFLRLREQEFVVASRALGFSSMRTIFRHVLPNAMSPVLVAAAFSVASGILTESAVSFLGLGISEPQASWGAIVNESKNTANWWIQMFPGFAIFVTVTCYNLVGDAVRDAMDPKMKV